MLRHIRQILIPTSSLFLSDSPLTGEAHRVSAAFKDSAAVLQESEVKLAVIDVSKQRDLAKKLNGTGPPTIRLYLSGDIYNPVPCPGTYKSISC